VGEGTRSFPNGNLNFVGIDSSGSMQGSWTFPATLLARLPDELPLRHAALVELTAVAVHDVRHARVRAGEKVVVGAGPVGLLVAVVARTVGPMSWFWSRTRSGWRWPRVPPRPAAADPGQT
jgi:threonine dehydrogenase-like Zn-dependent dehydrogenase